MPWFHVNGIPVLAKDKATAVAKWKEGKLVKLYINILCPRCRNYREAVQPDQSHDGAWHYVCQCGHRWAQNEV